MDLHTNGAHMSERRALLAIHDPNVSATLEFLYNVRGYIPDVVTSFDELERRLDPANALAYHVVIMEANLGQPGSTDFSPARRIWRIVQERSRNGELHFRAISGRDEVVEQLRPEGIPVLLKDGYEISDLIPKD